MTGVLQANTGFENALFKLSENQNGEETAMFVSLENQDSGDQIFSHPCFLHAGETLIEALMVEREAL